MESELAGRFVTLQKILSSLDFNGRALLMFATNPVPFVGEKENNTHNPNRMRKELNVFTYELSVATCGGRHSSFGEIFFVVRLPCTSDEF